MRRPRTGPIGSRLALGAVLCTFAAGCAPAPSFITEYTPEAVTAAPAVVARLQGDRLLERLADDLDAVLRLKGPLVLAADTCGESNAFYDPDARRVLLCVEMVEEVEGFYADFVRDTLYTASEAEEAIEGALRFSVNHEVAHALIDRLDLPVTGREEDAADQLATLLLDDGTDAGGQAALDGAEFFYEEPVSLDSLFYWDEHVFGAQRFYNIACWVYGRDPDGRAVLVEEGDLPEERAEICADEYARMVHAWLTLLGPVLRRGAREKWARAGGL